VAEIGSRYDVEEESRRGREGSNNEQGITNFGENPQINLD